MAIRQQHWTGPLDDIQDSHPCLFLLSHHPIVRQHQSAEQNLLHTLSKQRQASCNASRHSSCRSQCSIFSAICVPPALHNISLKVWKVILLQKKSTGGIPKKQQQNISKQTAPVELDIDGTLPRLITKDWKTRWGFHRHSRQMPPHEAVKLNESPKWIPKMAMNHPHPKKKYRKISNKLIF